MWCVVWLEENHFNCLLIIYYDFILIKNIIKDVI